MPYFISVSSISPMSHLSHFSDKRSSWDQRLISRLSARCCCIRKSYQPQRRGRLFITSLGFVLGVPGWGCAMAVREVLNYSKLKLSHDAKKKPPPSLVFPTRSNTNPAVLQQKMARGLGILD